MITKKYPELKIFTINDIMGAGAALQHSGGRVIEAPYDNGRVARYFGAKILGPSLLTSQGHQIQILFSSTSIALHA